MRVDYEKVGRDRWQKQTFWKVVSRKKLMSTFAVRISLASTSTKNDQKCLKNHVLLLITNNDQKNFKI